MWINILVTVVFLVSVTLYSIKRLRYEQNELLVSQKHFTPIPHNIESIYREIGTDCNNLTTCDISDPKSCFKCRGFGYSCVRVEENLSLFDPLGKDFGEILPRNNNDEGYCIKNDNKCSPNTSLKILARLNDGSVDYVCRCKYPKLVDQENIFADCDLVKSCPGGGKLTMNNNDPFWDGVCDCPPGSISKRDKLEGPVCIPETMNTIKPCFMGDFFPATAVNREFCICKTGYVTPDKVSDLIKCGYKPEVAKLHVPTQCLKKPCLWDLLDASEYHEGNEYVANWGCKCDYANGWVGVRTTEESTSGFSSWVSTPGPNHFNACLHIATPSRPHNTETFFFTTGRLITKHIYRSEDLNDGLKDAIETRYKNTIEVYEPWIKNENGEYDQNNYFNSVIKKRTLYNRMSYDPPKYTAGNRGFGHVVYDPRSERTNRRNRFHRTNVAGEKKITYGNCGPLFDIPIRVNFSSQSEAYFDNLVCISDEFPYKNVIISNPRAAGDLKFRSLKTLERGNEDLVITEPNVTIKLSDMYKIPTG